MMDDMKARFARIIAWAKEHPWIAGLIVGAVVLVAWWVYKKTASSSGTSDETTAATDSSGVTIPDYSGIGSGDGSTTYSTGSSGNTGSDLLSALSTTAPSLTAAYEGLGLSSSADLAPAAAPVSGRTFGDLVNNLAGLPNAGQNKAAVVTSLSSTPASSIAAALNAAAAAPVTSGPSTSSSGGTPSQQVGKGKHFTGTYQGVTYSDGYPVSGYASGMAITSNPSSLSVYTGNPISNISTSVLSPASVARVT